MVKDVVPDAAGRGHSVAARARSRTPAHRVALTVSPGADACEDCLVPKDVFRGIASHQLGIDGDLIDITYPVDLPGYSGGHGSEAGH